MCRHRKPSVGFTAVVVVEQAGLILLAMWRCLLRILITIHNSLVLRYIKTSSAVVLITSLFTFLFHFPTLLSFVQCPCSFSSFWTLTCYHITFNIFHFLWLLTDTSQMWYSIILIRGLCYPRTHSFLLFYSTFQLFSHLYSAYAVSRHFGHLLSHLTFFILMAINWHFSDVVQHHSHLNNNLRTISNTP